MNILIDAQIIADYYREDVLEQATELTASAMLLFERLNTHDSLYMDVGGQIEQEWRNLVDYEWFEAWFGDLVGNGRVLSVEAPICGELLRYLAAEFGFPSRSGDKWYIRTAKAVCAVESPAVLVTEDAHFHEPACQSSSGRRMRVLTDGEGAMARYLRRREDIWVRSVCQHGELCR